jgi:hypothetical protein
MTAELVNLVAGVTVGAIVSDGPMAFATFV